MEKGFYKKLLAITIPITVQNMICYSVNMMDTLMIGSLGEEVLSAANLAGQIFFMYSLLMGGLASGAGVLCSQYYGKRDIEKLRVIIMMLLKMAVTIGMIFVLALIIFPKPIMWCFTPEKSVIAYGTSYLRTIAVSYLFYSITTSILIALRSVQDVQLSVKIYVMSLIVNVFFNYVFIFGHFGAPKLGIVGAALGTVIARGSEVICVIYYIYRKEKVLKLRLSMLKLFDRVLFKDLMKYGLPVTAGEFLWGFGVTIHSVILGHMGAAAVAANGICNVMHQFVLSFVQGMGSASSVIMGNYVGAGKYGYAKKVSKVLVKLYAVCGITTAAFMLIVMEPFFSFYQLRTDTLALARRFMIVYAVITVFRSVVSPIISGIFWGSGDTVFATKVDMGFLWALIPAGFLAAFVFRMDPALVLLIMRLESPIKMVVALFRLRGDKWIKPVVRESC